jgi:hypothetical protein
VNLQLTETAPPQPICTDFISDYVKYADVIEVPPEAHEAVATQLLASVLNPNVYIQHGAVRVPLDLWLLLLSSSGFGRNTLVDLARPILNESVLEDVLRNVDWGSKEAFYQNIAQYPTGLYIWPELSFVLKKMSESRFAGMKEWITDRYDNCNCPPCVSYRQTGHQNNTPPIIFSQAPRLNLLATSSFDWFVNSLEQQDTTGGFVPRWFMVKLDKPTKLVPIPREADQSLIKPLAQKLRHASELSGQADLSQINAAYERWYAEAHHRFSMQPNAALAMVFFNRHRTHVLKLAVIYEVSRSLTLTISHEALNQAIETARRAEESIFKLLPTGMSREGAEMDKMAERVRLAGVPGILLSSLTKAFQHLRRKDREDRICTLLHSATVYKFTRKTDGRSATVLVHQDFLEEHRQQFPDDTI